MREIKFRVWEENIKQMFYNVGIVNDELYLMLDGVGFDVVGDYREFKLMQYTGLKDKNFKEIYEGDILTSEHYPFQDEGKYNYHGVVEWIDEYASFFLTKRLVSPDKRGISDGISEPLMDYDMSEFEIIGNIYEHSHLLEGEK